MHISRLKIATRSTSARVICIFIASMFFTIIVNAFIPSGLPLLLTDGKRPGIPASAWNELCYTDARKVFEMVSSGKLVLIYSVSFRSKAL